MTRQLTVARIGFSARTDLTERAELEMRAASAGIGYYEMLDLVKRRITEECQVVADGVLADMASWGPEQWRQAKNDFA